MATGRGDFPNQVNNSMGFPGILKGALMVRARKITDEMAIAAAYSVADFAQKKAASTPTTSCPPWTRPRSSPMEAADVAMQAIKDGVARIEMTWDEVFKKTMADIKEARDAMDLLMEKNFIKKPDIKLLEDAVKKADRRGEIGRVLWRVGVTARRAPTWVAGQAENPIFPLD